MSTTTLADTRAAAAQAQQAAEAAHRKAQAAQDAADRAAHQAEAEADARLRTDAQRIADRFDQDLAAATTALHAARAAFTTIAVQSDSFTEMRDRYLDWQARALEIYWLHRALQNALGRLGQSTWRGRAIPSASLNDEPPPFSAALDAALARAVTARGDAIEDAFHARIHAIEAGEIDG